MDFTTWLISPVVIPGIIGAIFCALDRPFIANFIWIFSNLLMAIYVYNPNDLTASASYIVFQLFAVYGVIRHVIINRKEKLKSVA